VNTAHVFNVVAGQSAAERSETTAAGSPKGEAGRASSIRNPQSAMAPPRPHKRSADTLATDIVILCAAAGDGLLVFAAMWIVSRVDLSGTARLIPLFHRGDGYAIFGALTIVVVHSAAGMYSRLRLLHLQLSRLCRAGAFWSCFYAGFVCLLAGASRSALEFACATMGLGAGLLAGWRLLLHRIISDERIASHLRQRIVLIGWTPEAGRLSQSVWQYRRDPCEIIGYVELASSPSLRAAPPNIPFLGTVEDLPRIFSEHGINVAWLTDVNLDVDRIPELAAQCEKEMVEFKIIPSYFPILLSAIHVETVCGTPILGVDRLPLNFLHLRALKRLMDIVGAAVGLILATPIIALFCALVYAESPGPVFYRQTRMGRKGKPFPIIKIRSMRVDAERGGKPGWTTRDDPRRLRIGGLIRKWNIDELPQFWNVLKGDMSLVGPRPERPELIQNFKHEIEHYNARHTIKPGVTGWAQVNGLRGDTDLSERIRHDIYYMEHWNFLFDLRIMVLTFFRHANAC
jgi:exopolysaccharide biosynthesis polyprenyl glycosylphosphotransferase